MKSDDGDDDDKSDDNDMMQPAISFYHSQRFAAGGETEKQILNKKTERATTDKALVNLQDAILQRKNSGFHLIKQPEVSLIDKRDTITAEHDEVPSINPYFVVNDSQVKGTNYGIMKLVSLC
uniref:Uncharacterized protein n=1 Tax=Setaria digitata TaxID=48799 RepID=A0A915PYS9_9BILA